MKLPSGRTVDIAPGMAAMVQIHRGRRSVIEYLLRLNFEEQGTARICTDLASDQENGDDDRNAVARVSWSKFQLPVRSCEMFASKSFRFFMGNCNREQSIRCRATRLRALPVVAVSTMLDDPALGADRRAHAREEDFDKYFDRPADEFIAQRIAEFGQ